MKHIAEQLILVILLGLPILLAFSMIAGAFMAILASKLIDITLSISERRNNELDGGEGNGSCKGHQESVPDK